MSSEFAIPSRLHPVRCGSCGEVWFCKTQGVGGVNDRDFWPRYCCYCGINYKWTTWHDEAGSVIGAFTMDGRPIGDSASPPDGGAS